MKKLIASIGIALLFCSPAWAATVTLNITAGTNAISHTIEKSTDGGAFVSLITLPMPTIQHIDNAVLVGHAYSYRSITNSLVDSSAPSVPCSVALLAAGDSSINCTVNP